MASNLGIIGIKTVGGESFDLGIEGDKRVGFIVENASTFLDADVLQFLRIRLFRNGEVVYENVIDESNVVGVGLIGSEQSQKIRYSVKVPASQDFDEFQLWTSGVLNLGLNTLRIYYGFMESADDDCSDPLKMVVPWPFLRRRRMLPCLYKYRFKLFPLPGHWSMVIFCWMVI